MGRHATYSAFKVCLTISDMDFIGLELDSSPIDGVRSLLLTFSSIGLEDVSF